MDFKNGLKISTDSLVNSSNNSFNNNKIDNLVERNNAVLERARALALSSPSRTPSRTSINQSYHYSPSPLSTSVTSSSNKTTSNKLSSFDLRKSSTQSPSNTHHLSISRYAKSRRGNSPNLSENNDENFKSYRRRSRIPSEFFDSHYISPTTNKSKSMSCNNSEDEYEHEQEIDYYRPNSRITNRTSVGEYNREPFPSTTSSSISKKSSLPDNNSSYRRNHVSSLNDLDSPSTLNSSNSYRPIRHSTSTSLESVRDEILKSRMNRPSFNPSSRPATSMAFSSTANSIWSPTNIQHSIPPLKRSQSRSSYHLRSQSVQAINLSPTKKISTTPLKHRSPLLDHKDVLKSPNKLTPASSKRLDTLNHSLKSLQIGLSRLNFSSCEEITRCSTSTVNNVSRTLENVHRLHAQALEFKLRAETDNTLFSDAGNVDDCRVMHNHAKDAQRATDDLVRDLTDTLVGMSRLVRDLSGSQSAATSPTKGSYHGRASSVSNILQDKNSSFKSRLDGIRSHRPGSTSLDIRRSSAYIPTSPTSSSNVTTPVIGYRPRNSVSNDYISNHHRSMSGSSTNTIKNSSYSGNNINRDDETIRPSPRVPSPTDVINESSPSSFSSITNSRRRSSGIMSFHEHHQPQPSLVKSKPATTAITRENAVGRTKDDDRINGGNFTNSHHKRSFSSFWPWNPGYDKRVSDA